MLKRIIISDSHKNLYNLFPCISTHYYMYRILSSFSILIYVFRRSLLDLVAHPRNRTYYGYKLVHVTFFVFILRNGVSRKERRGRQIKIVPTPHVRTDIKTNLSFRTPRKCASIESTKTGAAALDGSGSSP